MEAQNKAKAAAAELKKDLEKIASNGRFAVSDRVNHIRRLQKVDGVEIYAVQYTTIQRAAATDNVAGIAHFLRKGHLNKPDEAGNTALHVACRWGYHNVISALAEAGADVNCRNKIGQACCHLAVAGGHTHLLEILFDMGADLALKDGGGATPAHYAAQVNRVDILEALYQCQDASVSRSAAAEVLSTPSLNGATPAHVAAQFGNLEALDFLHRRGVDLTVMDAFGETPAHKAARAQQWRAVRGLQKLAPAAVDLGVGNVDEDSAADLLADKSRFWTDDDSSESLRSLRELAKMRRDGEVNHSDFRRLKSSAIDHGSQGAP